MLHVPTGNCTRDPCMSRRRPMQSSRSARLRSSCCGASYFQARPRVGRHRRRIPRGHRAGGSARCGLPRHLWRRSTRARVARALRPRTCLAALRRDLRPRMLPLAVALVDRYARAHRHRRHISARWLHHHGADRARPHRSGVGERGHRRPGHRIDRQPANGARRVTLRRGPLTRDAPASDSRPASRREGRRPRRPRPARLRRCGAPSRPRR
jgi:hypothetical protein